MADSAADNTEGTKKKKKNILEEKSKEELIELVKKYLNLLQKFKNKTDELNKQCSTFENEKIAAIQEHQSTEKELLSKIAVLRKSNSELTTEKVVSSIERDKEIAELKKRLNESSVNIQTVSLRENEEQLQCLNSQLQSLKASCQCIQEENNELCKKNKELSKEIATLNSEKKSIFVELEKKKEDYNLILNVKNNIEIKYKKYVDENVAHSSKTDDSLLLFTEVQDLKKTNKDLQEEIIALKKAQGNLSNSDSEKNLSANTQNEFQTDNSNQLVHNLVQKEISDLQNCKSTLEEKIVDLESDLEKCHAENWQLQEEVKKLVSLPQLNDYKTGFELALLQGASTESLMHFSEEHGTVTEIPQLNKAEVKKQKSPTDSGHVSIYSPEEATGLEYALLQGGDMSGFVVTNRESITEINYLPSPSIEYTNESSVPCDDDNVKDLEIESLRQKLHEYSDLCSDTLEDNRKLQQELAIWKKAKVLVHQEVNTDFDDAENEDRVLVPKRQEILDIQNVSEENYENLCQKIVSFYRKICVTENASLELLENDPLVLLERDPLVLLNTIENLYSESVCEHEKKCSELDDFNLQLELLVITIKQGVRQKNTSSSYQAENNLEKNMSLLKALLDNLVMSSNNYASEIRSLESGVIAEKKKIEDELINLKELNQFLEDENSELNHEVKKLKCSLSDLENCKNQAYYRENYQRSPELYSIDESNELDEKMDASANIATPDILCTKTVDFYDIAVQTEFLVSDIAVQTESDLPVKSILTCDLAMQAICTVCNNAVQVDSGLPDRSIMYDFAMQTDYIAIDNAVQVESDLFDKSIDTCDFAMQAASAVCDNTVQVESNLLIQLEEISLKNKNNEIVIDELMIENESLKKTIQEKSILVEKIHCQMDSLLEKIEDRDAELQEKENDLKHSKLLNSETEKMLLEAENIKQQQNDALKAAHNSVLELKVKNNNLNDDIKSYGLTFKEFITHVNDNIMNIMKQSFVSVDHYMEKCNRQEQIFIMVKEWLDGLTKDFTTYFNFLDQMMDNQLATPELEILMPVPQENVLLFKTSDQGACCVISEDIKLLNSVRFNFFSKFYNHINNNYISLVKNINDFKHNIIPKMEMDIATLEKKLSQCTCQIGSEEVKKVEVLQKEFNDESLKNQLADSEIKMAKLKKLALKLKKELAQTKEQHNEVTLEKERLQKQNTKLLDELNKISDDQCKHVQNYQSLQNEFDKLQDECEVYKVNIKKLEEDVAAKLLELTTSRDQVAESESQLKSSKQYFDSILNTKKELEVKCADLESKLIVLESKLNEKGKKMNSLELEVSKHLKDLNAAWDENKNLKNHLELAQKEGNKKNLLDLEMADYERSISDLNNQIMRKEEEIGELQSELDCVREKYDCLQEEMQSTEVLKETEAKRAESLRDSLEKTKIELNEVKEHEAELLSKNASLEVQLEALIQQEEQAKLRLSESSVQVQHLQDVIKTSSDNHHRIIRSFEQKVSNQKQEIMAAHKEVESVKQEFENYKIRVHSVLKQQKTITPAITTVDSDLKEKLETMNDKLRLQVKDLSEKLTAFTLEYETLQEEHDGLLQRYNKVIDDREEKDKEWHQRLEQINAEKNRLRATQEELSSQHLLQNEMLVATYKKQIKIMSEEHKRIVSDLQKQLDAADIEIARMQRDQQKQQGLPLTPLPQDTHPFDIMSQERQEGEGSESTDETTTPIRHLSLATIPTSGFLPFEKLLQSPLEPGTPTSYISSHDSEKLSSELNTANKKIDHLSELLNDSESTSMRLSEQVRVLKEEVRRIENNKEREQHAENLEYLKNVFIKFASLQPGSEKAMLVPVLTTMLKLSSNEQQQLKSVAGDIEPGDSTNSGWSSYLHRWSGLS